MRKITEKDKQNISRGFKYLKRVKITAIAKIVNEMEQKINEIIEYRPSDKMAVKDELIYEIQSDGRVNIYYVPENNNKGGK